MKWIVDKKDETESEVQILLLLVKQLRPHLKNDHFVSAKLSEIKVRSVIHGLSTINKLYRLCREAFSLAART
jgi:hypothetical protein